MTSAHRLANQGERAEALRRFKPYPAYKDSGVEWLGEIPAHWTVTRISELMTLLNGYPFDSEFFTRGEGIPLVRIRDLRAAETEVNYVGPIVESAWIEAGDVIIGMDGDFNVARWRGQRALLNQRMCCLRPRGSTDSGFIAYLVPLPLRVINDVTYSTTVKHLSSGDVRQLRLGAPPESEQRAIAAFLDRETARIDALVAKKQRLIELLQEQRTALVTRAVTKGLDPSVRMKDSGVEWLEEIPAHWEVLSVRRRAKRIQTGSTPSTVETKYYEDGVIPWYGPASFADALPIEAPSKFIAEMAVRDGVARVFEPGSSVIVTIGATIGKVAFLQEAGSCNQQITAVTFDERRVWPKFGAYQLKRLEPVLRGIAPNTTLPILDQEEVGYLPCVIPPYPEQRAMATFLDRETARIDALVAKVHEAIDRLRELRTAIISAAVTGKIDVREKTA